MPRNLLQGWNVLIVDDEPDSLMVAQMLLEYYGAEVKTAENGQKALDVMASWKPRFVLSDISMPVMDGWQLIYRMQNDDQLKSIPMIALTAHAMVGDRERAIRAGYHNYITKPITPSTFMRELVNLLVEIPVFNKELAGV